MPKTKLGAFCDGLIEAGWLAALVVAPLFFNVWSDRVFEPDKITAVRSIALVMAGAWLVKLIEGGLGSKDREERTSEAPAGVWTRIVGLPLALPTLALVVVYLVSTAFSMVPRVSFVGSYQRLQGTYSMLSYVVISLMVVQGIRTRKQIERLVTTVVLTSVPIAMYGIIQHYGLDPLPWGGDVQTRVAGHMGNPIFVSAYLIMALPLTLYRTVESFIVILTSEESRVVDIVLGAAYIFILAIQGICIFFTQSRGPWLGLVGGLFFFFLVLAVVRRWRWLVWSGVVTALAFLAFLVVFNLPSSPLESLREAPYIGRLGRVLDKEEITSKVRLLIWQGAIEMILPHPPLERPDGTDDWMNWARPLIGYGPESMYVAYNRFYPPDLAHYEARNATPDRSHNETFDSLVTTGLVGFLAYMWLFASIFYHGFRWLGIIVGRAQRNFFIACWIGGGVTGAVTMGLWQGAEFVGVGLPAGIAAGLGLYLVVWGLFISHKRDGKGNGERAANPYNLLVVALVSAILGHFVEIHFGIAIGATRTYFWAYVGLLAVVGYVLPRQWKVERERAAEPQKTSPKRRRRRSRGKPLRPQRRARGLPAGLVAILPYALVLALVLSTLAYNFVSNSQRLDSAQRVLWASLTQRKAGDGYVPSYALLGLVLVTWFLGCVVVVGEWMRQGGTGAVGSTIGACLLVSILVALLFAMILASSQVSAGRQTQLLGLLRGLTGLVSSYYLLLFAVMVVSAVTLLQGTSLPTRSWQTTNWWLYPVLLAGVVLIVLNTNLGVVHADIAYKQAKPYEADKLWDFSIVLHQEAIRRVPREDLYYLFLGRAYLERARTAAAAEGVFQTCEASQALVMSPQQVDALSQGALLDCSDSVLNRAREINPLNTDHSANLGRLYRTRAQLATVETERDSLFRQALTYYEQATSLSPHSALLFNEWGLVYYMMQDYEAAIGKYEYSLTIDSEYVNTYMQLADVHMAINELGKAKEFYLRAAELDDRIPETHSVLAYLYGREERFEDAIAETLRVLELTKDKNLVYNSFKNLALYYQQLGNLEEGMRAAQEALARAPDNERAAVQGLVDQLAAGGAAPETDRLVQQYLAEGEAALNGEQWGRAEQAYKKALALNPNLVVAHSALSFIYAQQGRLEEAARENLAVLQSAPDDFASLKNLAIIYRQMRRYDESLKYAQLALDVPRPGEAPQKIEEERRQIEMFIDQVEGIKAQE